MACTKLCRSGSTNISRLVLNQGIFRLSVIGEITPCMHTYYRKTFLLCFLFQSSGNIGRGTFTFRIPVSKIPQRVFHRGCSLVAVLNTANIYGPREFTPNEVLTACGNWGANGLNTWALPSECNGKIDTSKYTHGGKVQATVFSAVKASIDNNLPIIIRLNSSNGKKTHFVTAIAYTGDCSSASSISVIDPAGGVIRTLEEAGTARNETVYGDYIATARRS